MSHVQGVIFDVDGTLIDSNDLHAQAWVDALAENGYAVPFEQVRRLIGMGGDKLLPEVSDLDEESPEGKRITARRSEIFKQQYLPKLRPFAGVEELLRHMRDSGVRLVVASSAQGDELTTLLEVAKANDFFMATTSSSDAESSKPDPDIVEAALQRIELRPEQVVMIGDTPYDVQSAGKAGVKVIALRCGGWNDEDLGGAIAVYDDLVDLRAHYDESPLGHDLSQEARGAGS